MPSGYKIKKIYVGQNQVRPSAQKGQFNFKTMSLADLTAAGFTYQGFNGASVAIDSTKGLYATSDGQAVVGYPVDLSNATSVTSKFTIYGYSGSWCGGPRLGIATGLQENISNSVNTVGCESQFNTNGGYRYQDIYVLGSRKAQIDVGNLPTGEYLCELSVDLSSGAIVWKVGTAATVNYTMTASEITSVKSSTYLVWVANYNGGKQHQVWSVEWEIQ